jgi:hypothetical protein
MLSNKQLEMIQAFNDAIGVAKFTIRTEQNDDGDLLKVSATWEVPTDEIDTFGTTTVKKVKEYSDG